MKIKVKENQQYGRLTTTKIVGSDKRKNLIWECKCVCGNIITRPASLISTGHTKSCGCLVKERWYSLIHKHGQAKKRIYQIWANIIQRCDNKKVPEYKNYGGRGIKYNPEWKEFKNFYRDMSLGYNDKLEIDRIDNNGHYYKENCRWTTRIINANNRRTNHLLEHNGKKQNLRQWSNELGLKYSTLVARINEYHWTISKALNI